jgi:hypothetical protein
MVKITTADVRNRITSVQYHCFPGSTVTTCLITLDNTFQVLGDSVCQNKEDFQEAAGKQYAFDDAVDKAHPFLVCLSKEDETNQDLP